MDLISILSLILAIFGTSFGIFVALRTKQLYRPIIRYTPGTVRYFLSDRKLKKVLRSGRLTTIAFSFPVRKTGEHYVFLPFSIENTSNLPVNNVRDCLEYPSACLVTENDLRKILGDIGEFRTQSFTREAIGFSQYASISMEFPVLRPGEKMQGMDILRLDTRMKLPVTALSQDVSKVGSLLAFFTVNVSIFSANCAPVSSQLNVIWVNCSSEEQSTEVLKKASTAFWGGSAPAPGVYFVPFPWVKLWRTEYAQVIFPEFLEVTSATGRPVRFEKPMEADNWLVSMMMPARNYYEEREDNVSQYYLPNVTRLNRWFKGKISSK